MVLGFVECHEYFGLFRLKLNMLNKDLSQEENLMSQT